MNSIFDIFNTKTNLDQAYNAFRFDHRELYISVKKYLTYNSHRKRVHPINFISAQTEDEAVVTHEKVAQHDYFKVAL